jgi:hypothetical protein
MPGNAMRSGVMRLILTLILAITLCGPAFATTPDAFRNLVMAGDITAVDAALNDALAQDARSGIEPDAQLGLFAVFEVTRPAIDTFTANWLAQSPTSPNAMTARGWYLYAMGQAMRGSGYAGRVYPAALEAKYTYHSQAFELFDAAHAANPDLVAAANGVLQLTATLGSEDITPKALVRIMAVQPNRGSLMRAIAALPSYWGAKGGQVIKLCQEYAPKITSVPGYDVNTCLVDGIYFKGFQKTDKREAAHELLVLTPHPILDYARLIDAIDRYGPPEQSLEILKRLQKTRQLTPIEAAALDEANRTIKGDPIVTPIEYIKSLASDLAARKLRVARDPFNPIEVNGYVKALQNAEFVIGTPFSNDEVTLPLQALLTKIPYSGEAWLTLANIIRGDALDPNGRLARIEAAEPYYTNAVVYTDASYDALEAAMEAKGWAIANPENPNLQADLSALSAAELEQLDQTFHCPLAITYRLLLAACKSPGSGCGIQHPARDAINARMMSVYDRGACLKEINVYQLTMPLPAQVDF